MNTTIKVKSNILKIDDVTPNGYYISKEVASKLVETWNNRKIIEYGKLLNADDVPGCPILDSSEITHKINGLSIDDDFITANMEIFDEKHDNVINDLKNNKLYAHTELRVLSNDIIDIFSIDLTTTPNNKDCIVKHV